MNRKLVFIFLLLVVITAVYRMIPHGVNFTPQIALALFCGAIIKDKRWAFVFPVLSMFISDVLYQILFLSGWSSIPGFYEGQWQNYLLFVIMTCVGFLIRKINIKSILSASIAAPVLFFILSNFLVWMGPNGPRGLGRPKTFQGLLMCYNDALPFFPNSLISCVLFSGILFGSYYFLTKKQSAVLAK